jgi:hypothetical protein
MKYDERIMKAVNRFPLIYKKQALAMLDMVRQDSVSMTFDGMMCASMLVLIQEFGFGTRKDATRLKKYAEEMQRYIDDNCKLYDEVFIEGMKRQLKAHGIDYVVKE